MWINFTFFTSKYHAMKLIVKAGLFLLLFLIPLLPVSAQELRHDTTLTKYFDKHGIAELEKISAFFTEQLKKDCDSKTLSICYGKYVEKTSRKIHQGASPASEDDKLCKEKLFEQLDEKLFSEIWTYNPGRARIAKDSMVNVSFLGLNPQGQYVQALEELAQEGSILEGYLDIIKTSGDISPNAVNGLIKYYDQFDVQNPVDRLILAIQYITVNSDPSL